MLKVSQVNNFQIEQLQDTLEERSEHSACWLGEASIVLTGGYDSENKCEILDCGQWQPLPDLNQGRRLHSSAAFNSNTVYVFCGRDENNEKLNSIERWAIGEQ